MSQRIRVMRVIARINVGGPAMQVAALHRGLDPDRFDHRLYTGHTADDEVEYQPLGTPDVQLHRIATLGRRLRASDDTRALGDLIAEMRRFRPHIVHTHTAKAGVLGRAAAVLAGVPARVHTFHGHLLHGYFPPAKTRLVVALERALARRTDLLVTVGRQVRDDLLRSGVGDAGKYVVIAPGTTVAPPPERAWARRELGLPADAPVVAYVGRVTGIKRPDRLVAVARQVRRAVPGVRFVVCGSGDQLADTRQAARDLGDTVRFTGWRGDVETIYAAADLTILTSDNEGMPVSLIESALAGVPAVAARVGSVAEVVSDGVTGLLCQPEIDDLVRATVRLLRDQPLRHRMGRDARTFAASRFSRARLVADTDCLYTSIAVDRGWWPPAALGEPLNRVEVYR